MSAKHAFQIHHINAMHITKGQNSQGQTYFSDLEGNDYIVAVHSHEYVTDMLIKFDIAFGQDDFNDMGTRLGVRMIGAYDFNGGFTFDAAYFFGNGGFHENGEGAKRRFGCDAKALSRFETAALDAIGMALSARY